MVAGLSERIKPLVPTAKSPRAAGFDARELLLQLVATIQLRLVGDERLARMCLVLLRFGMRLRGCRGWRRGLSERSSDEHRCNQSNCQFLHVDLQRQEAKSFWPTWPSELLPDRGEGIGAP